MEGFRAVEKELERSNQWAESLNREVGERGARIEELQEQLAEEQRKAVGELERRDAEYRHNISVLTALTAELSQTVEERTAWARGLDENLARQVEELSRCVEALHDAERTLAERTRLGPARPGRSRSAARSV